MLLTSFSDDDWAGESSNRRSTSGFLIYLGCNLVSWSSKKQPTVAQSSTEAEYKAIANATSELLWITSLFHARMKHNAIDFHFVHEQVALRRLHVSIISDKDQPADLLTKSLPKLRFLHLRSKLNLHPALSLRVDVKDANRPIKPDDSLTPLGPIGQDLKKRL